MQKNIAFHIWKISFTDVNKACLIPVGGGGGGDTGVCSRGAENKQKPQCFPDLKAENNLCCVVPDGQISENMQNVQYFFVLFSDGEIISQIKMTNIALAEIKELLKQQVKTARIKSIK